MTKPSISAYRALRRSFPATPFTQLFSNIESANANHSIKIPILQAPMMGSTSPSLIAAVCNTGALGQLPAYKTKPEDLKRSINQLRTRTNQPFSVNLGVPRTTNKSNSQTSNSFDQSQQAVRDVLNRLGAQHNLQVEQSINQPVKESDPILPDFYKQLNVVFDEKVPILSFVFGLPDAAVFAECRKRGILTIGAATSVAEVAALRAAGVDAIVVQGAEAGGHRGGFMYDDQSIKDKHLIGLLPLLSSIRRLDVAGSTPLIAAGGIADGAAMVSAFMHGASAVQIGTAFLTCTESISAVPDVYRDILLAPSRWKQNDDQSINQTNNQSIDHINQALRPTVMTRSFTSRPARGFTNHLNDELQTIESNLLPWPHQNALVSRLVSAATKQGDIELMQMWVGQAYSMCQDISAAELIEELMKDSQQLMNGVA